MDIKTATLKITGEQTMHCGGCENTIKFTLGQLPGIQQVDATHKTQLITLTFDPQTVDIERIYQELDWVGYQATEITET